MTDRPADPIPSTPPARPTRLAVPFDPKLDHFLGSLAAPVELIEYGDYECPDCGQAYPIVNELRRRFADDRLRFVFRHFPLYTIHSHASVAAQAAEAAGAQGKYWSMHDLLYQNQDRMEVHDLTRYAIRAGLDLYRFEDDLSRERFRPRVEADYAGGERSGVRGTPTLFLNGERYVGKVELESLVTAVGARSVDV